MQFITLLGFLFQTEKYTELHEARQIAFMSQHIDLEKTGAEMFFAAYHSACIFGIPV